MNKRKFAIGIFAIATIMGFVIMNRCRGGGKKDIWANNKVSASYQKGEINEPMASFPPTAKIYIDASGSMKPYFKADGSALINTISEIKNLNVKGTDIYFLNNPRPFSGLVSNIITEVNKQPNESTTTFHRFFEKAAAELDTTNTIIYLVTDGIMSVTGDTQKALVELRGLIASSLKGHKNLAGAIFRYEGKYQGDYWNSRNQRISPQQCPILANPITRPYYIIALGHKDAIRKLENTPASKLNNPKALFMGIHDYAGHQKAVLSHGDSATLGNINQDVTLILELPECLKDIDAGKVKLFNNETELSAVSVTKNGNNLEALIPVTQPLRALPDQRIRITMKADNEIPAAWLTTWNTDDDLTGPDQSTTFGLSHLVKGMFLGLDDEESPLLKVDFTYSRK